MKLVRAYAQDAGTEVVVLLPGLDLFTAVAKLEAMFATPNAPSPHSLPLDNLAGEQAAPTSTSTEASSIEPTRRRRRTAAEMEAARAAENPTSAAAQSASENTAPPTDASTASEGTSRRRRAAAPVSTDPMPITDAELSKAASHTADELVKIGEDGPGLVMAVLEDYGVRSVGEIAVDRREAFIRELAKELDLAKQEHASKQA